MFVSAAVKLSPEAQKRMLELSASGAFDDKNFDFIGQLIQLLKLDSGTTDVEVASKANVSLRTIHQLDRINRYPEAPTQQPDYESVFLSYGGPDEAFTRKLFQDLTARGVKAFFFPESSVPGQRLHRAMNEAIHQYDRILLVCSRSSVIRPGILNELEQVLSREAREGGTELLIPVLLDNFVLTDWEPKRPDLLRQVRDRVVADFRKSSDEDEYSKQLSRLLTALTTMKPAN